MTFLAIEHELTIFSYPYTFMAPIILLLLDKRLDNSAQTVNQCLFEAWCRSAFCQTEHILTSKMSRHHYVLYRFLFFNLTGREQRSFLIWCFPKEEHGKHLVAAFCRSVTLSVRHTILWIIIWRELKTCDLNSTPR
jgi:hypothetical protein